MYTRCPKCLMQHQVSAMDLRISRGMLRCNTCSAMFDALEFISDNPMPNYAADSRQGTLFSSFDSGSYLNRIWLTGLLLGVLVLATQVVYFEGHAISQNRWIRTWLQKFCQAPHCRLPDYKNSSEVRIAQNSLKPIKDSAGYRFSAIITNQAPFPQPYPAIRLTLLDYTGNTFAERVFSPGEYRHSTDKLAVNQSAEVTFDIATPSTKIGGYKYQVL